MTSYNLDFNKSNETVNYPLGPSPSLVNEASAYTLIVLLQRWLVKLMCRRCFILMSVQSAEGDWEALLKYRRRSTAVCCLPSMLLMRSITSRLYA